MFLRGNSQVKNFFFIAFLLTDFKYNLDLGMLKWLFVQSLQYLLFVKGFEIYLESSIFYLNTTFKSKSC